VLHKEGVEQAVQHFDIFRCCGFVADLSLFCKLLCICCFTVNSQKTKQVDFESKIACWCHAASVLSVTRSRIRIYAAHSTSRKSHVL